MNTKLHIALAGLTAIMLVFMTSTVRAAESGKDIVLKGNGKGAIACSTCHGAKGQGNSAQAFPYLAGQPKHYLIKQLEDYASGKRESPIMQPFAKALSKAEINAVAAYFAGLPSPQGDKSARQAGDNLGKKLAEQGNWSAGMPACFQCHGENGEGVAPNFPAISGQSQAYLQNQLQAWRNNKRSNDPIGLMQAVVAKLSDQDISAVAKFLASYSVTKTH